MSAKERSDKTTDSDKVADVTDKLKSASITGSGAVEPLTASISSSPADIEAATGGAGDSNVAENLANIVETNEMLHLLKMPGLEEAMAAAQSKSNKGIDKDAIVAALKGKASVPATTDALKGHRFWDTQPVPKIDAEIVTHGPIDPEKSVDEIKKEPLALPGGYEWVTLDITKADQLDEMYELLKEHYVEDDENMFRFNYSAEFLRWALTPPHYYADWHVGVRKTKTGSLVACITGVPAHMMLYDSKVLLCEINFLCVHKTLRSKRLAPVLIKEVTRRVNLKGIWQAAYTAGVVLPKPVSSCQYWHRSINPKKLIEVGFSRLAPRMTMNRTIRLYDLPAAPKIPGIRPLVRKDVQVVTDLLNNYLNKFSFHPVFSREDFAHWMLPREGVIDSYVVEDPTDHKITDFISFYFLPSSILGNDKYKTLSAVYSYYNVYTKHTLKELMEDALVLAKLKGVDVFNALDLMDNGSVVKDLKFGPGDGHLQYYLYNWQCPDMAPDKVGLVLL